MVMVLNRRKYPKDNCKPMKTDTILQDLHKNQNRRINL